MPTSTTTIAIQVEQFGVFLSSTCIVFIFMRYKITKERLRRELEYAFRLACKHKQKKQYVKEFKKNLAKNLDALTDELFDMKYIPSPSFCFIIHEPKIREIFAAKFVDRIVHHLYFNQVADMYDSLFIEDSYSCRYGKGSHYGVSRLYQHIRRASQNYTKEVYILQLDIKGYFISINRDILLKLTVGIFEHMRNRRVPHQSYTYDDCIDFDFIKYLNEIIITNDPIDKCILKSSEAEWEALPDSRSLFRSNPGCGLPIGNLTSQLLSNVYLNELDQYIKRELKCKHYGRYVDDLYIVSANKKQLLSLIPKIQAFITEKLHLELNSSKTRVTSSRQGVKFLGYYIKERRIYLNNKTLRRMLKRISNSSLYPNHSVVSNSINSYFGMFKHCASYRIRYKTFNKVIWLKKVGFYDQRCAKFIPFDKLKLTR